MEKKQNGEKCTGTFTKRIGNTTYRVNVHFAEETTDTVEDKLLHLMGTGSSAGGGRCDASFKFPKSAGTKWKIFYQSNGKVPGYGQ